MANKVALAGAAGTELLGSKDGAESPSPTSPPAPAPAANASRKRVLRLLAGGVLAVLASGAIGYKVADWRCAQRAASGAEAWRGTVGKIVRGGADGAGGLSVMGWDGSAKPIAAGAAIGPGTTLMTDARTRARLAFDDGTSVVLDRATQVTLGDAPRTLDVKEGALLADVASLPTPSTIRTGVGWVRASGAKVSVTATPDRTSVEVLRGEVDVGNGKARDAHVASGQEAALTRKGRLEVSFANDLGQRAAFGEAFVGEHNEDTDAPVGGLGELRAKKPGSKDEKDHAVRLARHDVKVRVVGNLARTEIDETFQNDTNDVLEGVYRFPLPPGAQIERLALEVDGKLVEGEFVDKAKAAAIFRGAIHNATPQAPLPKEELIWVPGPWHDPALLEWQRGGRSELHIFPIPRHGTRRVVIAYTETIAPVAGVRRYVYPLPQATASDITVDHASFDVQVLGADPEVPVRARGYELAEEKSGDAVRLSQSMDSFTPSGDLVLEYALPDTADMTAWAFADTTTESARRAGPPSSAGGAGGAGDDPGDPYVAVALRPKLPNWQDAKPRDQVIVVDAGRAMFGERFQRAKRLAIELTQEMDRRDRVTVLACDVGCRAMPGGFEAPGAGAAHDADAFLATETPDGASDLVGAVRAATTTTGRDGARDLRVILISDGVASAGYRRADHLESETADALPDARAMVVAVPIGTDADVDSLAAVARGGGGVVVPYAPGEKLEAAALDTLGATYGTTLRDVELTLPDGLYAQAPAKLAPMRAGGETIVAARMKGAHVKGDLVLRGKVGGEPFEAKYALDIGSTTDDANAFVPRLYASARVADDEQRDGEDAKKETIALSERFAVPSKRTSLLVLESGAMFDAFGIARADRAKSWTGESAPESAESADEASANKDEDDGLSPEKGGADKKRASLAIGGGSTTKAPSADLEEGTGNVFGPRGDAFGGEPLPTDNAASALGLSGHGFSDSEPARATASAAAPAMAAPMPVATATAAPTAMMPMTATPPPEPVAADRRGGPYAPPPPHVAAQQPAGRILRHPQPTTPLVADAPWQPRQRGGQWMKRQWFRTSVVRSGEGSVVAADKLSAARAALAAAPDERKRHMELVELLERSGAVDDLADEVDRWSARDPMDADAISARADVLERRGERDAALRVLGGTAASITEDPALLTTLALADERAGHRAEACAFRVAAAEVRPDNEASVADAVRCERAAGHTSSASRWLTGMKNDAARTRVDVAAAKSDGAPRADNVSFGDIVVDGTWEGGKDFDLAVVDPSGTRMGWATRAKGVRAADCTNTSHETLAVTSSAGGAFVVEVARTDGSEGTPIRGTLRVRGVGGAVRLIPFVLTGTRAEVARVDVRWDSQLVPASNGDVPHAW